jgi:hypothetical protein
MGELKKAQKKLWIISEYWTMPLYLQPFSDGQELKCLENQQRMNLYKLVR